MVWADRKFPAAGRQQVNASSTAGDAAMPSIVMKDLKDREVTLAQYKGQVVLVNFWATWCEPCKIEIPWMIEFQKKYSSRGFTILGVSMDEEGKKVVDPYLEKERFDVNGQKVAMNYPILLGNDSIADKFGSIVGLPTSMLFTRDGKKVKTIVGLVNHDDIAKAIEGLL
jgi:cytochrome c biogenesis protein CcmG/thiol:disulfide interchange protein DsbE